MPCCSTLHPLACTLGRLYPVRQACAAKDLKLDSEEYTVALRERKASNGLFATAGETAANDTCSGV